MQDFNKEISLLKLKSKQFLLCNKEKMASWFGTIKTQKDEGDVSTVVLTKEGAVSDLMLDNQEIKQENTNKEIKQETKQEINQENTNEENNQEADDEDKQEFSSICLGFEPQGYWVCKISRKC